MTEAVEAEDWRVLGSYFEACNCDAIGPAIGEVHAVRRARITVDHLATRKRIDVVGYITVEAEGAASDPDDVQCGIPGFDHPGTELYGQKLISTDEALRWEIRGGSGRRASFATDFDYRSPSRARSD